MKRALIALIALLFVLPCYGQQPATQKDEGSVVSAVPKDQQATREDILALFDVLHSRRTVQAVIETMMNSISKGFRNSYLEEHPNASPAMLKKLDTVFASTLSAINLDDLLQAEIPVYQKYISHEDAVSLLSFYSSPTGQRYLERMPLLLKESSDASQKYMAAHMKEIRAAQEKALNDLNRYEVDHPDNK